MDVNFTPKRSLFTLSQNDDKLIRLQSEFDPALFIEAVFESRLVEITKYFCSIIDSVCRNLFTVFPQFRLYFSEGTLLAGTAGSIVGVGVVKLSWTLLFKAQSFEGFFL